MKNKFFCTAFMAVLFFHAPSSMAAAAGDVERLPDGVLVKHVVVGSGAKPDESSTVTIHYEGKIMGGAIINSTYLHGQPVTFGLSQVIPCWTEALQFMAVGGKARVVCPSATAYGSHGSNVIPPNSDLLFNIELVSIERSVAALTPSASQDPR